MLAIFMIWHQGKEGAGRVSGEKHLIRHLITQCLADFPDDRVQRLITHSGGQFTEVGDVEVNQGKRVAAVVVPGKDIQQALFQR